VTSVVVPVLDEARRIADHLAALRGVAGIDEIVVVDGGSRDETVAIAQRTPGVRLVTSARGRGVQMNAGARAARGDVLLFLHADAALPPDAARLIERALDDPGVVAGAFRLRTVADGGARWLGPLLRLADLRSRVTRLPYGDQAVFVRRAAFERIGGFPDQPLMEDIELARRLWRVGRIRTVPGVVRVSGRRFVANPVRAVLAMRVIPLLYRLGVSPARLARLYGDPR
jgi:rSAM/selenodomain-associated transferase 2